MLPRSEQSLKTQFWAGETGFVFLDEFPQKKRVGTIGFLNIWCKTSIVLLYRRRANVVWLWFRPRLHFCWLVNKALALFLWMAVWFKGEKTKLVSGFVRNKDGTYCLFVCLHAWGRSHGRFLQLWPCQASTNPPKFLLQLLWTRRTSFSRFQSC